MRMIDRSYYWVARCRGPDLGGQIGRVVRGALRGSDGAGCWYERCLRDVFGRRVRSVVSLGDGRRSHATGLGGCSSCHIVAWRRCSCIRLGRACRPVIPPT